MQRGRMRMLSCRSEREFDNKCTIAGRLENKNLAIYRVARMHQARSALALHVNSFDEGFDEHQKRILGEDRRGTLRSYGVKTCRGTDRTAAAVARTSRNAARIWNRQAHWPGSFGRDF